MRQGGWKVNEKDIDAFNVLFEYTEHEKKRTVQNNILFAKMYITMLGAFIQNKGVSVFSKEARRDVELRLKMPLTQVLEEFTQILNDGELYYVLDKTRIKDGVIPEGFHHYNPDHVQYDLEERGYSKARTSDFLRRWEAQREKEKANFYQEIKETPEVPEGTWNIEDVKECLIAEINNLITEYGGVE